MRPTTWFLVSLSLLLPLSAASGATNLPPRPNALREPSRATAPNPQAASDDALVTGIVRSEETALVLNRKLSALSRGLLDLALPGPTPEAARVFAASVNVVDLGPAPATEAVRTPQVDSREWPVAAAPGTVSTVDLWRPLLDAVDYFEQARFSLVEGDHPGGDGFHYEALGRFEGLARMKTGEWRSLRGRMQLFWERAALADGEAGEWQIVGWRTLGLQWCASPKRWFSESLDRALRPPQDPKALRRSQHYEATVAYYRDGMKRLPHPYFAPISVNQKEGVAVADVNGDGFDDLYIAVRLGKNMLLLNRGDGTFTESAAEYHLDLPGHTTCAIFADFDNDGDQDVMLGRSLLRTSYLENRGGVYYQHPIPKFMPMAVISMAAADYNGDGLLDIYLCTYRPAAPAGSGAGSGFAMAAKEGDFDWPDEFFSPEQAREFRRRLAEHKQRRGVTVLDQLGPPNVLLVNRGGGRFEPAPENDTVGLWRNSLQATWCDFNRDGRPDLYIPNDWGLNVLFRNDGPAGFKDVTAELGLTYYGFSMGASFGDYDNDGRDDLYVSNMFSDIGRRIISRIDGLDGMFAQSAMGNWLYHGEPDGRFRQVAGPEPPAMTVMRVGWSWGGCFADFDNDRFQDLYVLSGYFTAPPELASHLDLESNLWRSMVRSDDRLARPTFRFSPAWRRTPPPDNLGPQIDARLAGVERQGDRIWVHSLHGEERNRYFANQAGRAFQDASGLSGLDNPADSRGFAILDYDRDGWLDLALVNGNQPLFQLYHNDLPGAGVTGGVVALRFVGGNRTPFPTNGLACRDGFGARVEMDLGDGKIVREHRCGEGWSTQNSATMLVGIGSRPSAVSVTVHWPSGKTETTRDVPEGTLLTVYESPAESSSVDGFTRAPYRAARDPRSNAAAGSAATPPSSSAGTNMAPSFAVRGLDTAAKPARLHIYTTFSSSMPTSASDWPALKRLKETVGPTGVDVAAVPIDANDDDDRLAAYARQWKPASRFVNISKTQRAEAAAGFARALGQPAPVPSTVITDDAGRVLAAHAGVPHVSEVRKWLSGER